MSERERFSVIETASNRKRSLEERLKDFPELRARIERMLEVVENSSGDVEKAATAEEHVTVELRQMGNEVLHSWARRQEQKKEEKFNNKAGVNRKGKKNSTGSPDMGK
jgi:hypothetical protein